MVAANHRNGKYGAPETEPILNFSAATIPHGTKIEIGTYHGCNVVLAYCDPVTGERKQLMTPEEAAERVEEYLKKK